MLLDIRIEKGLTQEEMAKALGVSSVAYHMYETGKRKIPKEIAKKIVEILELESVDQIFLPSTFSLRE